MLQSLCIFFSYSQLIFVCFSQPESDPSVIVVNEPEIFADLITERLHGFDKDEAIRTEQRQYQCRKFFKKMRMEANERLLSDSDSSSSSTNEIDTDSDEGCYHVLREARRLRRKMFYRRRSKLNICT